MVENRQRRKETTEGKKMAEGIEKTKKYNKIEANNGAKSRLIKKMSEGFSCHVHYLNVIFSADDSRPKK